MYFWQPNDKGDPMKVALNKSARIYRIKETGIQALANNAHHAKSQFACCHFIVDIDDLEVA